MTKILPVDPRPSKADEVQRKVRKELEQKHGGFTWMPYVGLGLTGLLLAMNVPKEVEKCEKKHKGREHSREREGERNRERRERDHQHRDRERTRGRDGHRGRDERDGDRRRSSWAPEERRGGERVREQSLDPYWDRRWEQEMRWEEEGRMNDRRRLERVDAREWEQLRDRRHSSHYAR